MTNTLAVHPAPISELQTPAWHKLNRAGIIPSNPYSHPIIKILFSPFFLCCCCHCIVFSPMNSFIYFTSRSKLPFLPLLLVPPSYPSTCSASLGLVLGPQCQSQPLAIHPQPLDQFQGVEPLLGHPQVPNTRVPCSLPPPRSPGTLNQGAWERSTSLPGSN